MDLQHNDDLDPVAIRHFSVIPSKKNGFNSSLFVSKRRTSYTVVGNKKLTPQFPRPRYCPNPSV